MTRATLFGALALACVLALASPAAAAKRRSFAFEIPSAQMSEVVTFHGDGGPACARAGVCGYSGRVAYGFGSGSGFAGFGMLGRQVIGFGSMSFGGLTTATVTGPDGSTCSEKAIQRADGFVAAGHPGRLRIRFHVPGTGANFLDSYCAGPRDSDIASSLPTISLPGRLLRRSKLLLHVQRTTAFHAGPFAGTVTFSAAIRLRRVHGGVRLFFVSG